MHMFCDLLYTVWYDKTSVLLEMRSYPAGFKKHRIFAIQSFFHLWNSRKKVFVGNEELWVKSSKHWCHLKRNRLPTLLFEVVFFCYYFSFFYFWQESLLKKHDTMKQIGQKDIKPRHFKLLTRARWTWEFSPSKILPLFPLRATSEGEQKHFYLKVVQTEQTFKVHLGSSPIPIRERFVKIILLITTVKTS